MSPKQARGWGRGCPKQGPGRGGAAGSDHPASGTRGRTLSLGVGDQFPRMRTRAPTPHFQACCQRSLALLSWGLLPGARRGRGDHGCGERAPGCCPSSGCPGRTGLWANGKLSRHGCTSRCLDKMLCRPRTAWRVGWGDSVSGEGTSWLLTGQLAPSGVLRIRLRGSCDQYRLLSDTFGLGPEESPRIPQLRQGQVWGEMEQWRGLVRNQ